MPEIINGQPSAASTEEYIVTDEAATLLNTTHRTSDGKNHADVIANTSNIGTNVTAIGLNTTHKGSNGSDHSKVGANETAIGLNTTHRGSDGSNHSKVGDNETAIGLNTTHRGLNHDYAHITGNDGATDVTGAELEELTDGSETTKHSHAAAGGGFDSKILAHRNVSTAQSIPTSTWTKVELDTEIYDGLNEYDKDTNYRWTASANGYYDMKATVNFVGITGGKVARIVFVRNGGTPGVHQYMPIGQASDGNGNDYLGVAHSMDLAANDFIEVFVWHNHGSNRDLVETSVLTIERFA